jgi:TIR domain/SIR2-like domain
MTSELDDTFWDPLLAQIGEGEVVPIVGPGAVTFGPGDELLYPWLARRLPTELNPPLTFENPPRDLHEVVDAQRRRDQRIDRIYRHLYKIVENPDLRPGATLTALAAIEGFKLFISTTFDPLLPRAVESASPGGKREERRGAIATKSPCFDLPQPLAKLQYRFVYQILGRAEPVRDFVVWDDDVLHFLIQLDQQLSLMTNLRDALVENNVLILGLNFSDWLLRFFVQVIKRQRLSELPDSDLFVFEKLESGEREKVVIYFGRLTKKIRVMATDPREFIAELFARWRQKNPAPLGDAYLMNQAHREKHRAPGCIFVSYASPDLEIARYVVSQLQKAGCLVWFDKEQLTIGQDWKEALREAVDERCGLFLSLISGQTSARHTGYNIYERNLAAKRRDTFADNTVFYLPMRIDDAEPLIPENEPKGTKTIQGVRYPEGHLPPEFIGQLRDLQRQYCQAHGLPLPPSPV